MITTHQLTVAYGATPVLHEVSVQIPSGRIVALIGRNGAGKSTFLKACVGLIEPTRGSVCYDKQDITSWPTHHILARGISYMPQGAALFSRLSVEENIRVVNPVQRSYDEALERTRGYFAACLDPASSVLVGLLDSLLIGRRTQVAGTLSGGQRQIVCLARSLSTDPSVLLWDEPSIGLAPSLLPELQTLMRSLVARGKTILIVDQKVGWVLRCADAVVVMQKGVSAYQGTAESLREDRPKLLALMGLDNAPLIG